MQRVLPDPSVKDRIAKLCVGLAADCDAPEGAVETLMAANLAGAQTLPFAGFVTPDLKWVGGFAGYKDTDGFVAILDAAEKSPAMNAAPDVEAKLAALVAQAEQAVDKAQWPKVLATGKAAADLPGRSPSRAKIAAAVAKARAFADGEMTKALESVKSGGDRSAARVSLKKLSAVFAGEPEAKEAEAGTKAIERFTVLEGVAPEQQTAAREKAAKDFAGTRWTALFEKSKPADAK